MGTLTGLKTRLCSDASCTLASSSCCLSPLPHQIGPSLFFRKALKDTQICRLSESKNRSRHKAVAPEWASDWQRARGIERVSSAKSRTFEWENKQGKKRADRPQHTLTHTYTHMHTHGHHGALAGPLCCRWRTAPREPWVSELDKRE